jgi:threonine dehydratase
MTAGPRATTLIESPRLARHAGVELVLASETFQYTGSFKFRAAWRVATSVPNPRVLTASSGNFGQAMAYACQLSGKGCTVVMPHNSAGVKIDAVRAYGGIVDLIDTRTTSRAERIRQLAAADPAAYVASPYDDLQVIEGNSSLGDELAALPVDDVVAPVGGGGLTAGLVVGLRRAGSAAAIVGAEPLLGNDAAQSLRAGHIVVNDGEPQTLADGARTVSLGERNWAVLQGGLAGIVEVPEEALREAVRLLFSLANLKAEPTGALPLAALLCAPERFRGRRVCCVVSGGNVDPAVFRELIG